MSSVDAIAALAAQAAAMQDAGSADASLDLGAAAQVLQAQLAAGDVLEATVLAPKGGQDLIAILGQTVVAQLPPDVHPGDQLLLQVTGFAGNQILVRNLGVQDPQNPVPVFVPELPLEAPTGTASAATLTTIVQPQPQPQQQQAGPASQATAQPQTPAQTGPPVAPPPAVFVAASVVRPDAPAAQAQTAQTPSQATPVQTNAPSVAPDAPRNDIEARLAAARAATVDRPAAKPASASLSASASAPPPAREAPVPAAAPRTQAFSETVFAKPVTIGVPRAPLGVPPAATPPANAPQTTQAAPVIPQHAQLTAAAAAKDPVRLLAALRIPATPVTLAAARAAGSATQLVSSALQNLERVLAQSAPADARISTLQTVTSFIAHLDPRNGPAFAAQLSAFASNVLDGAEGKLAQLLLALAARGARAAHANPAPATAQDAAAPRSAPAAGAPAVAVPAQGAPAHVAILAQARAAERELALTQDLKSTVLSLLANPPAGTSAQLTQALGDTLTALTAMQMNALVGNQTDPSSLVLTIPVMFYEGGQAANIRVQRDAPKKRERLDADNFHIAFVLDTASLGTVAIDLETVGRTVKVGVKTDRASAVGRLQTSLPDLTARLEQLRYRVSSAAAEMALSPKDAQLAAAAAPAPQPSTNLDLQA